jgi:type VI secretion system secreted protein Hcp
MKHLTKTIALGLVGLCALILFLGGPGGSQTAVAASTAAGGAVPPADTQTAFDAFMKLGDIEGESKDPNHDKWIDVLSLRHKLTRNNTDPSDPLRNEPGNANHGDFTMSKEMDKSTPKLTEACCNGTNFDEVIIELVDRSTRQTYYMIKLKKCIVSSYSVSGATDGGTPVPVEEIAINYTEIEWKYMTYEKDGTLKEEIVTSWNRLDPTGGQP